MPEQKLFHITTRREAQEARAAGIYEPGAFGREGFIHCSYVHQVAAVANRIFRGRKNLVVLEIDPALLNCRIVDENLEGGSELFPHIYGKLRITAVIQVHDFPCDESGAFAFPVKPPHNEQ
jgi:uncharacterized protein (DUF952 family)